MKTIFLIVSTIFFLGSVRYLLQMKKAGIFPPKQVLKKRAATLFLGGMSCLVLAFIVSFL
jgi:hypothetical protein